MSRPGVTYTEVSQAAQQLIASGRTPTVEGIRLILGTGSNSTLGQHLRSWKTKQDITQHIATKEKIPEELVSALKGVWERVMNQSELSIQAIQQESQQALLTAKQEIQQLQQNCHECQQHSYQTQQERDSLTHDKSTLEHLLSTAKMDLAILTEKLAGLDHHQHEKQQRIDELHRQNQQIHANLEHYREASLAQRLEDQQRYEQQQHQLEQQLRQRDQELQDLRHQNSALAHEKWILGQENAQLLGQIKQLQPKK